MAKTFILNDASKVNSYGFKVSNDKIDLERIKSNPIMLFNHNMNCVIGRWDNIRVEGELLKAEAVFDSDDEESKKIEGKVDRGFLKGASIGFIIIAIEEAKDKPMCVTEWEFMEASIVGIPSNSNAIALYGADRKKLSAEEIKLSVDEFKSNVLKNSKSNMKQITLIVAAMTALGVTENSTEADINAAILSLKASADKSAEAINELSAHKKLQAEALVDLAIADGKLTADKKESFVKLAITDLKHATEILSTMPGKKVLAAVVGKDEKKINKDANADREGWNYLKWSKEDPKGLAAMRTNDSEAFEALRKSK